MSKKTLLASFAVVLPLVLIGMALLALGHFTPVQAGSLKTLRTAQDAEVNLSEISAVSASVIQTWTHTTRADWEQGTMDWLDSATISGSLQLAQRVFGESTTVTPRSDLGSGQSRPDIAVDSSGNAYAVWQDYRTGNADIYFAYRAAISTTWSASVKVNDDTGTAEQSSPAIAVDSSGNAYAVWGDERNGNGDVYFAYRPAGGSWGASVKVNDDAGTAGQGSPAIAVDASSNAYAVWVDGRNGDDDIYFATRPAGGNWGANIRVNDDSSAKRQWHPTIAVDSGGNAYAMWEDQRNGDPDIYFAYRPAGGNWGANVKVSDDVGTAMQLNPAIAVDASGNAYAVWYDERHGSIRFDIYFAHRPAGGSWQTNIKINDEFSNQYDPDIAVDASGNAYAVWLDMRNGNADIYFAYRAAISTTWSTNVQVNDDTVTAGQSYPAIAVDPSGNAYAVWEDGRGGNPDIYFATRPVSGVWGANVRVDDDVSGAASQGEPAITVDPGGNAYAVWQDKRSGNGDIYFAYRPAGEDWGTNVKVNDDLGTAEQRSPAIAVDASGNAYVVWEDYRNSSLDIYFAYRPTGGSWGTNVKVNDDIGTEHQWGPTIAVDSTGNAYAVWDDYRNGDYDVYFAYRPAGGNWGSSIQINDGDGWGVASTIAVDASGNAYAIWVDFRNGNPDIYFAYRATISTTWSANVRVDDDPGTAGQYSPAVAVDASGNAYAAWSDGRNNDGIYFAYRPAGGDWETNIRVNDDPGTAWQSNSAIAVDASSNAYAVWTDTRNGNRDIYFAYRPASGAWGTNVRVNDDTGSADQSVPAIAVDASGNAYVVWVDNSYGTGHIRFARSITTLEYVYEVQATNVRDTTFNVSWTTNQSGTGEVHYGTDPASLDQTAYDDRGVETSDDTHYVTLTSLTPETTYYFDVISGSTTDDNNGDHYSVTTGPTSDLPSSDTIYGQVFQEGGATPAEGSVVYITLFDHDGSGSPDEAALLSALVESSGYWYTNLGNARLADLSAYFEYSASGDSVMLLAKGAAEGCASQTVDTIDDTPAADMILSGCYLPGDLDCDGDVDVDDIMMVANRWRCRCGDDCYDPRYDMDGDCDIDIVDIMLVVVHWGETCGS